MNTTTTQTMNFRKISKNLHRHEANGLRIDITHNAWGGRDSEVHVYEGTALIDHQSFTTPAQALRYARTYAPKGA